MIEVDEKMSRYLNRWLDVHEHFFFSRSFEREKERERESERGRQTDRQTDRQRQIEPASFKSKFPAQLHTSVVFVVVALSSRTRILGKKVRQFIPRLLFFSSFFKWN